MEHSRDSSSSSQLRKVDSTSSLAPPVKEGEKESDVILPTALTQARQLTQQHQETTETHPIKLETDQIIMKSETIASPRQRPFTHRIFCSLPTFGSLSRDNILIVILCVISSCTNLLICAASSLSMRHLEDEDGDDGGWKGYWDGKWKASDDQTYECDGDNCNDGNSSDGWVENPSDMGLTENEIITYVSVGIVVFMALLCCFCYPEILILTFNRMCGCCCPRGDQNAVSGGGRESDYVGGQQERRRRRSRSGSRRSSRSRSGSRSKRSSRKEMELV